MSFLLTAKRVKPQLISVARAMVLISMHKAWDNCRTRNVQPEEPDFVASLVMNGTKILEAGWRKVLGPYKTKIAVTGIYCHQTPKVSFSGIHGTSCELGDLLWCHIHTNRKRNITRNAILYQAKKSSRQPYRISGKEFNQLKLYSNWPEFIYVSSGELNGEKRHVKPAAPRRGAQYLLIDDRPPEHPESGLLGIPGTYPIGSCISQNPLVDHSDLGLELVHSLELLSGNPFDERKTALKEIGWSRVIWDLLLISVKKAFRRSRSGYFNQPRSSGAPPSIMDGCFYTTSTQAPKIIVSLLGSKDANYLFLSNIEGPPSKQEDEWFDEGGGGLSVIVVETYELEE